MDTPPPDPAPLDPLAEFQALLKASEDDGLDRDALLAQLHTAFFTEVIDAAKATAKGKRRKYKAPLEYRTTESDFAPFRALLGEKVAADLLAKHKKLHTEALDRLDAQVKAREDRLAELAPTVVVQATETLVPIHSESHNGFRSQTNPGLYARFRLLVQAELLHRRGFKAEVRQEPTGYGLRETLYANGPQVLEHLLDRWPADMQTFYAVARRHAVNLKVFSPGYPFPWEVDLSAQPGPDSPGYATLRANERAHLALNAPQPGPHGPTETP